MCSYNDKETLSTLRFGARAKNIKNTLVKNEEKSAKELKILLSKAEEKLRIQEELIQKFESSSLSIGVKDIQESNCNHEKSEIHNSNASSAALFKLSLEVTRLKSSLSEFTKDSVESANELGTLKEELKESKAKVNAYESEFNSVVSHYMGFIGHLQLKFEQIYADCQDFFTSLTRIKKEILELKTDIADDVFGTMISRESSTNHGFSEKASYS